jgi:hypothetical protein
VAPETLRHGKRLPASNQSTKLERSKMKLIVSTALAFTLALTAGCVTASGNYCDVARAVRPSVQDVLTEDTARQILRENSKLEKLCGARP